MRHLASLLGLALCAPLTFVACGGSSAGDDGPDAGVQGDGGSAAECTYDGDCGDGKKCSGGMCVIGGCGEAALHLETVAPNLLLVVDRSCSMRTVPTGATESKWAMAVHGINEVITSYGDGFRWGLTLFPDITGQSCSQETFAFPVADGNGAGIQGLLTSALQTTDALYPDGPCVTNIDSGMQQAAADPALGDPNRRSYVMLVTDGAQSSTCAEAGGDAGSEAIVKSLYDTKGVETFVLGFGGSVDSVQLTKLANAGGAALPGTTKYYRAETATELQTALQAIAARAVSCQYVIDPAPPSLAKTFVWFEKSTMVPRDTSHMNGWDFDTASSTLTFYGAPCDQLQSKAVDDVDVVYDCQGPLL